MSGSDDGGPPAPEDTAPEWWRHANGRWVIGDAGRQADVVPAPAAGRSGTRPDTVVDGARVNAVTYRASSQRGLGHQQNGLPRQDAYLVRPTPDQRWLVGCVADGVSEAKLSHDAADIVCRAFIRILGPGFTQLAVDDEQKWHEVSAAWPEVVAGLPWQQAVDAANKAVLDASLAAVRTRYERSADHDALRRLDDTDWTHGQARKVMSSTAVAFAVSTVPADDGGHPAAMLVAAGDSSVLRLTPDRRWEPLTELKDVGADLASTEVRPLPRDARVVPVPLVLDPGSALAVITDGIGDPLGSGNGTVGRFLATMWATPPDLLAFAQHVGFYRRSFTDDRTAVVLWSDPGPDGSRVEP